MIILHAITPSRPLAEKKEGKYVSDLKWNKDTPHPTENFIEQLTCETLWLAESHKGDYHDNMSSEIFVRWVQKKLFPTFEKLHSGEKMVLVLDNALYHHKREIGSLGNLTKKELVQLMIKYNVEYVDLPLTTD